MNLSSILIDNRVDPRHVLVMRHRPQEPELRKVLPWLAADRPQVFNAFQQTHGERVERAMLGAKHGHEPGKALFVGLYSIGKTRPMTETQYWQVHAHTELKAYGHSGFSKRRPTVLWFDLALTEIYAAWKGKLIITWPSPERAWMRRAHRNVFPSPHGKATLHEISRVMGLPGKPKGFDGSEVEHYFREGKIKEIADYCETDVVGTYQLWLRYELFRGQLSDATYRTSELHLVEFVKAHELGQGMPVLSPKCCYRVGEMSRPMALPVLFTNEQGVKFALAVVLAGILAPDLQPFPFQWVVQILTAFRFDDPNLLVRALHQKIRKVVRD
jgi:Predicted 3'-5' exonuclease related to the exonuclease domain of PolB